MRSYGKEIFMCACLAVVVVLSVIAIWQQEELDRLRSPEPVTFVLGDPDKWNGVCAMSLHVSAMHFLRQSRPWAAVTACEEQMEKMHGRTKAEIEGGATPRIQQPKREPRLLDQLREETQRFIREEYARFVAMGAVNIRLETVERPSYGLRLVGDLPSSGEE